jgi:hypothetical protein
MNDNDEKAGIDTRFFNALFYAPVTARLSDSVGFAKRLFVSMNR